MDPETIVYNLVRETAPVRLILLSKQEIEILENNYIKIKNISHHQYSSYTSEYDYKILNDYKNQAPFDTPTYLLGIGTIPIYQLEDLKTNPNPIPNLHILETFNAFKYIAKYPEEIQLLKNYNDKNLTEQEKARNNQTFVATLKRHYKTSLFYCARNTGIAGVEGYREFHEGFYKYLDTVQYIYLINEFKPTRFISWLKTSKYCSKIRHLCVHIGELYKTNPELIAYYRMPFDEHRNYLDNYYGYDHHLNYITDRVALGYDYYRHENYYKDDPVKYENYKYKFPKEITHILNVSDEQVSERNLPTTATYEYYPISERDTDTEKIRQSLYKIADRIHEILQADPNHRVYVHCSLGMNRSPAAVIMYFMRHGGMSLYDAYRTITEKRQIFTAMDLFELLYQEAQQLAPTQTKLSFWDWLQGGGEAASNPISPLKLRTHYVNGFCANPEAYMFALYDTMHLDRLWG